MIWLLKIAPCKQKHDQNSVRFRGAELFNLLMESNVLPPNFDQFPGFSYVNLVHKIRDNFILSNIQLTKTVSLNQFPMFTFFNFFLIMEKNIT